MRIIIQNGWKSKSIATWANNLAFSTNTEHQDTHTIYSLLSNILHINSKPATNQMSTK